MNFHHLNDKQNEAVTSDARRLLVLAGAGTGKTETLTRRIAWLIKERGVAPDNILAVTFTNKAAREMRRRVMHLTGPSTRGMWIGTFHGMAHRLLRQHWREAGLDESFQIINYNDQDQLLLCIQDSLDTNEDVESLRTFIGEQKNERRRPDGVEQPGLTRSRIYKAYDEACERHGVVDFEDLLLRSYELLLKHPPILGMYMQRFRHILVDEFQDTNTIQYDWLLLLAGPENNLTVVGDDDQAIYGWRGAKVENILGFENMFPDAQIVRLEQSYRSTSNILNAANNLIARNRYRHEKNLWTDAASGDLIGLHRVCNEYEEAEFIAKGIERWVNSESEHSFSDVAVLYRARRQSEELGNALEGIGIPYRIYGGDRAYPLLEIGNACAYLRLVADCSDDASLRRVINVPKRGIDPCVFDNIIQRVANERGCTLWQACVCCIDEGLFVEDRVNEAVRQFLNLISSLHNECINEYERHESPGFSEQVRRIIHRSGLKLHHGREGDAFAASQVENLEDFEQSAIEREEEVLENAWLDSPLAVFANLYCDEEDKDVVDDHVRLMTMHTAKGQEFPMVILTGMEDDIFPNYWSMGDPPKMEEERRLCYVGITRARRKLWLCHALNRYRHSRMPSRFIREIPGELFDRSSSDGHASRE